MDERRRYQRIYVQRHAGEYDCSIEMNGKNYYATLLDIGAGGARFSVKEAPDYDMYGQYGMIKNDYYDLPYILSMNYKVAWNYGDEIGVSFSDMLDEDYETLNNYYTSYS